MERRPQNETIYALIMLDQRTQGQPRCSVESQRWQICGWCCFRLSLYWSIWCLIRILDCSSLKWWKIIAWRQRRLSKIRSLVK